MLVVVEGWKVLAVAACSTTSVRLWHGVIQGSVAKMALGGHSSSAVGDVVARSAW